MKRAYPPNRKYIDISSYFCRVSVAAALAVATLLFGGITLNTMQRAHAPLISINIKFDGLKLDENKAAYLVIRTNNFNQT